MTIGIVQVIKKACKLTDNIVPAVALIAGLILTILGNILDITPLTFLTGIAVGLSASGLFDQKKILELIKK